MTYYHSVINKKEGDQPTIFAFNLSKQNIDEIVNCLSQEKPFMFSKFYVKPFEVESIRIVETEEQAVRILSKGKKKRLLEKAFLPSNYSSRAEVDGWFIINSGKDVTKEFTKRLTNSSFKSIQTNQSNNFKVAENSQLINELPILGEWKKLNERIRSLQFDIVQFNVQFIDRDSFKCFADNLSSEVGGYSEIFITGYFSEAIRDTLEKFAHTHKLKIISQEFEPSNKRDRKNLEVLRKICNAGAEVKVNNRLHARFLLAHSPEFPGLGILIIGSFDFNTEGMSKERYDAGIKTKNPDLVLSARNFFNQIWNEPESVDLNKKYL